MDKYTVDLDQVLNDFEYSELTTEQQQQQQSANESRELPLNTHMKNYSSAKHSINNVFSSLNEYLNSDISEKIVDNNFGDNNVKNYHEFQRTTGNLNVGEMTFMRNDAQSLENDSGGVNSINMTPVKEKPLESLISEPILLKIDQHHESIPIYQMEEKISPDELTTNVEKLEIVEVNDANAAQTHSNEAIFNNCEKNVQSLEEEMAKEMADVLKLEIDSSQNIELVSCVDVGVTKQEIVVNAIEADLATDTDNKTDCDKITIGFHNLVVDDEEARKYLDDLQLTDEDDEDDDFHDVQEGQHELLQDKGIAQQREGENEEKVGDMHEILHKFEENHEKIEEEVQENLPEVNQHLADLPNVEEIQVNIEDNMKNEVIAKTVEQRYEENIERRRSTDENENEESGATSAYANKEELCQKNTAELIVINNQGSQEMTKIRKNKGNKCKVKLAETISEAQRPNSLDIKEPVNLIGNPGSTPYNNLYVSKEVSNVATIPQASAIGPPQPQSHQYESESSASVSPTFSEASTDSVHSVDADSPVMRKKHAVAHGAKRKTPMSIQSNQNSSNDQGEVNAEDDNDEDEQKEEDRHEHQNDEIVDNEPMPEGNKDNNNEEIASSSHNKEELVREHLISEDEDVYVDLNSITNQESVQTNEDVQWLGKRAPLWIPDAYALCCQHCDLKFTVIKRRHHCRACGLVLCSKCCNMKHKLEYLNAEVRVCTRCHDVLNRDTDSGSGDSENSTPHRQQTLSGQPNPNNPMEYCSVVPPHQQVATTAEATPPSVMVPVGVLKRKGSNKKHNKSVMFCDGIRPGSDLTNLDNDFNYNDNNKKVTTNTISSQTQSNTAVNTNINSSKKSQVPPNKVNKNLPLVDPLTQSFIPENENCLPPTVTTYKSDITYSECGNNANVVEMLKNETLTFAVQRNLHIHVRLINMDCCVNKQAWCFSTEGLITVGQDEIVILLETIENETQVPKDVFHHLNNIYNSAVKGTTVTELGLSIHPTTNFLDSRNHAGFIFVRPTFQCLQNIIIPKEPYLVGLLVHRWETPWARIFPLRLVLRLGAEYRYYPSPLISTRHRDSVFVEIGHTIINLLADFRNFSYTLPNIRGLTIHMEEKSTTVSIPANRYDQVMKSISNSSEHILAFGGNFSCIADSHLVCIQDTQGSNENNYKTHAINIQNKPRKVTGASFIVFNGALKSTSGLTAKSSIIEDGLMIQIPPEHMIQVRESLRNMKNHTIQCGCVNAASDETVNIVWSESEVNFNMGVKSSVDGQSLSGIPSIRVHNGKDHTCNSGARVIRWTEVFLLQNGEENARTQDPVDISKVAESISKATCQALVKYLDLLATNNFMKIGIRTTLHVDDVSYSAGSNGTKLPPIYMKSLDNELVPVLHRITSSGNVGDGTIVLELIFRILNV